jgi:hypothetical protein
LAGSGLSDSALAAPKRPFAQRPLSGRLDGRVSTLSGRPGCQEPAVRSVKTLIDIEADPCQIVSVA